MAESPLETAPSNMGSMGKLGGPPFLGPRKPLCQRTGTLTSQELPEPTLCTSLPVHSRALLQRPRGNPLVVFRTTWPVAS